MSDIEVPQLERTAHVPVARASLTSDLATAVVDLINEQGLVAGMRIGPQRELAARFGVAVPTLREALRHLEALGILSIRHGSGIFVGEHHDRSVLPNAVPRRATIERLVELTEARVLIEPPVVRRAAVVRDPAGLARLEAVLGKCRDHLERGDAQLWKVNVDLHRAIGVVAGNRIVGEILDSVLLVHAEEQRQILTLHGDPDADHAEHEEIVRLIAAGQAEEVAHVMTRHLEGVVDVIRTKAGPQRPDA